MSEKLTLARYLKGRGEVKALTHIEALAFGVPYPLQPGWPSKYGAVQITEAMIEDLKGRIATARQSTASKARRGLDALLGVESDVTPVPAASKSRSAAPIPLAMPALPIKRSPVLGFVLRRARRFRKSAPWA